MIAFEHDIAHTYNDGRIRAPIHLAGGNEEQLIDIFQRIQDNDWVISTWRSHYHCLLKGVPPDVLKHDILAGQSITLNYHKQRVLTSAIVAGGCPIGIGLAMAIKRIDPRQDDLDDRVWIFVGDMASKTGMFHECWSYAQGHRLPVTFVVEDNGKSVCTPTYEVWGKRSKLTSGEGIIYYQYDLPWPHAGTGTRINF